LCPLGHYSQNVIKTIPNLNDLGFQEDKRKNLAKNGATKGVK
jgi:hypothetical protein